MLKESFKTIAFSLITISLVGVAYAWTEPTSIPPAGNVNPPITTASNSQTKAGWLTVDNLETYGNTYLATVVGNVGVGTTDTTGTSKLKVAGDISASGDVIAAGQSVCRKDGTNCTKQPTISQITFDDGTIQKTAPLDCKASEYLRKKSDNSGWECVSGLWGPVGALHYFVTSTQYTANIGDKAGMDAKCNSDVNRMHWPMIHLTVS